MKIHILPHYGYRFFWSVENSPGSSNPSVVDEEEEEGLPSPPLDEGAFFATQPTSIQLSEVRMWYIPAMCYHIWFDVELQSNFEFIFPPFVFPTWSSLMKWMKMEVSTTTQWLLCFPCLFNMIINIVLVWQTWDITVMQALEIRGEIMVGGLQTIQQLQHKNFIDLLLELSKKFNSGGQNWQGKSHQWGKQTHRNLKAQVCKPNLMACSTTTSNLSPQVMNLGLGDH